jgi:hypothetical protein
MFASVNLRISWQIDISTPAAASSQDYCQIYLTRYLASVKIAYYYVLLASDMPYPIMMKTQEVPKRSTIYVMSYHAGIIMETLRELLLLLLPR